ncbi:hypothetical protein EVAR_85535_1 [Eumeta japonica]|uniref:Uncharacterized protein n=1 Tax=Eumeta variegata TaxID=151549 RepID=A0A4C1VBX9_EUMVA|nr:hypothetical protein EVAR_85535_1 [Eumeta japonica]
MALADAVLSRTRSALAGAFRADNALSSEDILVTLPNGKYAFLYFIVAAPGAAAECWAPAAYRLCEGIV